MVRLLAPRTVGVAQMRSVIRDAKDAKKRKGNQKARHAVFWKASQFNWLKIKAPSRCNKSAAAAAVAGGDVDTSQHPRLLADAAGLVEDSTCDLCDLPI